MANKPVIDIDVNDQQFKAFFELFKKYQDALHGMPEDWRKVDAAVNGTAAAIGAAGGAAAEEFVNMGGKLDSVAQKLDSVAQKLDDIASRGGIAAGAQSDFANAAERGNSALRKMVDNSAKVGKTIAGVAKSMAKFGAWSAAAATGGIFALDRMGQSMLGNQRAARGLGLDIGQYRAFQLDFRNYLNPDQILGNVANQQNSLEGQMWLSRAAGVPMQQVATMPTDELAAKIAVQAHEWWQKTPANMRKNLFAISGFQHTMMFDDARRLGNVPLSELQSAQSRYMQDKQTLNVSDKTMAQWYEFTRQITLAGSKLETYFTKKLEQLVGPLGNFVSAIEKDAENLFNLVLTKDNIAAFKEALKSLDTYLGSQQFADDIKSVGPALKSLSDAVIATAKAINWVADHAFTDKAKGAEDIGKGDWGKASHDLPASDFIKAVALKAAGKSNADIAKSLTEANGPWGQSAAAQYANAPYVSPEQRAAIMQRLEKQYGLPAGLLAQTLQKETHGRYDLAGLVSKTDARGPYQFMPKMAKHYGISNPMNFAQEATGAAAHYKYLLKKYGGDVRKAMAAYNLGETKLDKDLKDHPRDWDTKTNLGEETYKYIGPRKSEQAPAKTSDAGISKLLASLAKRPPPPVLKIDVNNSTASRVAISMNALGGVA